MEKFGKVYILSAKDEHNPGKLVELPSIRFNNYDFKLYDNQGNLHPIYAKREGKKFKIHFSINQHDKHGDPVTFKGIINPAYPLGVAAMHDYKSVEVAALDYWDTFKSFDIHLDSTFETHIHMEVCIAYVFPGHKLSELKFTRLFYAPLSWVDDVLEKLDGLNVQDTNFILKTYFDIADGVALNFEEILAKMPHLHRMFHFSFKFFSWFFSELAKSEAERGLDGTGVRFSFKSMLEAMVTENSQEWRDYEHHSEEMNLEFGKELRDYSAGCLLMVETGMFDLGIEIRKEIRQTTLFKWIIILFGRNITWLNDVISYRKEQAGFNSGRSGNLVHLRHNVKNMPLTEAMQEVIDMVNAHGKLLVEAGEIMKRTYPGEENVRRFVEMVYGLSHGNFQWYGWLTRYHDEFVYDCVLDEEL